MNHFCVSGFLVSAAFFLCLHLILDETIISFNYYVFGFVSMAVFGASMTRSWHFNFLGR